MSPKKKPQKGGEPTVALCYIRQSFTRNGDDIASPERQRANILAMCEKNGWIPEFYEDAEGHRSGREVKNRPGWLALSDRLGDEDVVALVANDLARLHRKGWRVGDLMEHLKKYNTPLVLTAPGREIDTTSPLGMMMVQLTAFFDEYYAEDISQRQRDSIAYRKALGKNIGQPPFGTMRNKEGYLTPSTQGAWLLPDGTYEAGTPENQPTENAVWRSYYECAENILKLYAEGNMGLGKIAHTLNYEGWAFRDRNGKPRPLEQEDIRRVIANWGEYGGLITDQRSKDRHPLDYYNGENIPFRVDRAVFPIDLLLSVAKVTFG